MSPTKRVLIVGGVAGGASCAARLRRLSEATEIVIFERGPYVSFANCGLPYHVGDVIKEEKKLLVATAELFRDRFRVDVRVNHEVVAIHRDRQTISVKNVETGELTEERYDDLVLSPGAAPIRPPAKGIELPGIFTVRTVPDARAVRAYLDAHGAKRAVVIGGGFIGLEMAENLAHRGLTVTVLEKAPQVMPPLDAEMAGLVRARLVERGLEVRLGEGFTSFEAAPEGGLLVLTDLGAKLPADIVILAIGVRPEVSLAREAGLTLGARGGIVVDATMRTADPHIYAVGDAIESFDPVTGTQQLVPLAGPANRQGRVAADAIGGRFEARFRGVQGTAVCGAFGLTIASTGASEKALQRAGVTDYAKVYLHPAQHAGYYPGATPIHLKLLFRPTDGRVLGAQAIGEDGVDKRIDVIATTIQLRGTVADLAEVELCYAPQYGSAKDAVNMAGFIAENARSGDMPLASWDDVGKNGAFLLDVREPGECARGMVEGATNIPLNSLRSRLAELPKDRPVDVYCAAGQRAYYAVRILRQHGYDARNLSGGYQTFVMLKG